MVIVTKAISRYKCLPKISFVNKVCFVVWKALFRRLCTLKIVDDTGSLLVERHPKPLFVEPRSTFSRLVSINGFSCSGSSAGMDLLTEYRNVTTSLGGTLDNTPAERKALNFEFDLVRGPGGVYELEHAFRTKNFFERDCAIRLFMKSVHYYYLNVRSFYDDKFIQVTRDFVLKLIAYQASSPTGFDYSRPFSEIGTHSANFVLGHDPQDQWQYVYHLKDLTVEEYRKLAAEYIQDVLHLCESNEVLVLDQGTADGSADIARIKEYFGSVKMVYFWRDPRDVFVAANEGRHVDGYIPANPDEFVGWYLRGVGRFKNVNDQDVLLVRLENLVMHYDETVARIERFIGLTPEDHVLKKKFFVPSISYDWGTGRWRDYFDQAAIRRIEELIPEYCYSEPYVRPEGPGLSEDERKRRLWMGE